MIKNIPKEGDPWLALLQIYDIIETQSLYPSIYYLSQVLERPSEPPLKSVIIVTEIQNLVSNYPDTKELSKDVTFIDWVPKSLLLLARFFQKPHIVTADLIPLYLTLNFNVKRIRKVCSPTRFNPVSFICYILNIRRFSSNDLEKAKKVLFCNCLFLLVDLIYCHILRTQHLTKGGRLEA